MMNRELTAAGTQTHMLVMYDCILSWFAYCILEYGFYSYKDGAREVKRYKITTLVYLSFGLK